MAFVHLHVHTQYSLLQGALHVDALLDQCVAFGMPAVAMTDTHNLFGAIDFYQQAKKRGIKPLIGCELYYAPFGRVVSPSMSGQHVIPAHHLVVLCQSLLGYQNLCQMVTASYKTAAPLQKQSMGPRAIVDRELLSRYGDGLIVLSGCLKGEIPYNLLMGQEEEAMASLVWFQKRFGDNFYLEIQNTGMPEQEQVNEAMLALSQRSGVPLVATADCHYLEACDADAHEVLACIEHGRNLDPDRPKSLSPASFYFQSEERMRESFTRFPDACDMTVLIAEKCNLDFQFRDSKGRQIYHLPQFYPEGVCKEDFDAVAYFVAESKKGLERRFTEPGFVKKGSKRPEYDARLHSELAMIVQTGFAGYFLIVADFINWAKTNDIPVGPGRGSGAGSLVAYSLRITDIDPLEFNLLFERFINPERISMPDFDVDFCQERRSEVIDYVSRKYGSDHVCQIITFGKLQARVAVRDVGRVFGLSFSETDQLTKLFPDELDMTVKKAIDQEPKLRDRMLVDPKIAQVMQTAQRIEGLYRNAGLHAAGVIITEKPVVSYCPLYVGRDGDLVTQFDKDFAETIGLVKFDFLGLKTLTVIDNAVKMVRRIAEPGSPESQFLLETILYDDPAVFVLIGSADTDGVFQIESSGMKDLCARLAPSSVEDLTAINALYRPGPLGSGMVDDFIERKHGRRPIVYDVPALASILKDTYGVILYQEQVMQIARELAGYSLGQADLLRRAMGKKKVDEMAQHRSLFVSGAEKLGFAAQKAEAIFDLMAKFAEYGFNKSHSAAYGILTYQTAYLKAHYPAAFMAALMTTEMDTTEKITKYIHDARQHSIAILPPDVNFSERKFSVEKSGGIRFGLEAIKGVGSIAVDALLEARAKDGPFTGVLDLCKRVATRKLNKKVMEALCLSGALDSIAEVNRASLFASLETVLEHAGDEQQERELGQSSLFDELTQDQVKLYTPMNKIFKKEEDWALSKKLAREREVVGFYVSGHPMDSWQEICEQVLGWSTEKIRKVSRGTPKKSTIRLAGIMTQFKEVTTKKGARMAFAELEDAHGKLEVVFFPEAFTVCAEGARRAVIDAEPVVVTAELEIKDDQIKMLAKHVEPLASKHMKIQAVQIRVDMHQVTPDQLRELKRLMLLERGKVRVQLVFDAPQFRSMLQVPEALSIEATPSFLGAIKKLFGPQVVRLIAS